MMSLNGGTGIDHMAGGTGNDNYLVDNSFEVVTENANEGSDAVSFLYNGDTLQNLENFSDNIEEHNYTRLSAGTTIFLSETLDFIGTNFDDVFKVNPTQSSVSSVFQLFRNEVVGAGGIDTLDLSDFNRILADYSISLDLAGFHQIENVFAADTSLSATISGNNSANVITGNRGDDEISGGGNNDTLSGGAGNDTLDGGTGADVLAGGDGSDTYTVDNVLDQVTETATGGTNDVITSSIISLDAENYANVETLELSGSANLDLFGDSNANILGGNAGNNVIDGGAGSDFMEGGAGDDTYVVDEVGDVVFDSPAGSTDTVVSANISLAVLDYANVENLTLTGLADLNLTGDNGVNILTGNAGKNQIDGGGGADTMIGGDGNDTYIVDVAGDVVTETATGGEDTIHSSVISLLALNYANVETLELTGTANLNLTGDGNSNSLIGNSGNNIYRWWCRH